MDTGMSNLAFSMMASMFKLRDLVLPRERILEEVGIRPGHHVLDYGCGPGGYVSGAADLVGPAGKVYALDLHPLALRRVEALARRRHLENVETIHSDCQTGLPDDSVDVVLLYDVFHGLQAPQDVLAELRRVLKPKGVLSFTDHHMDDDQVVAGIAGNGTFKLVWRGEYTYQFEPMEKREQGVGSRE